ncbi:MAG: type II toxin-antitoxin system RelE/ParE family toxin [Gammaproteobacteria bacterium]
MFTVQLVDEFQDWLDDLADKQARIRIVARLRQAEGGNLGDWAAVAGGLSEMRIHFGPGYRLYFTRRGRVLVVILCGGTKSTQTRDIRRALRILQELDLDR